MTRNLEIDLPTGEEVEARLEKFQKIRSGLALPRPDVERTSRNTRICFSEFPQSMSLTACRTSRIDRLMAYLVRVEREWGSALGNAVGADEIGWDSQRNVFALGPCFFRDSVDVRAIEVIAARLDVSAGDSFEDLLVSLSMVDERRAIEIRPELTAADRVRWLLENAGELANGGDFVQALQLALNAWELRPTDMEIGIRVLRYAGEVGISERGACVYKALADRPFHPVDLLESLSAYCRTTGQYERARQWADQAALKGRFSELARVANLQGDERSLNRALTELARKGNEGALAQLRPRLAWQKWVVLLEAYQGELSERVFVWRCEVLGKEERLSALLSLIYDNGEWLHLLEKDTWLLVVDAARRVDDDGVQRLVNFLRSLVRPVQSHGMLNQMFGWLCLEQDHYEEALSLCESGMLNSPKVRLKALRGLERWAAVIEMASSPDSTVYVLEAQLRLALSRGELIPATQLEKFSDLEPGDLGAFRMLIEQLQTTAGDQPVIQQIIARLGEE